LTELIYPPCRKCGAIHGIGIETMATGEIEPLDICRDCLFPPIIFDMNIDPIKLKEWEEALKDEKRPGIDGRDRKPT
jgi:hypothetical protein